MSLFEKNLLALRTHHPELCLEIEALPLDTPALSLTTSPQGEPDMVWHFGDGTAQLYHGGNSPLACAKDIVTRLRFNNPRLVVFLGLGLGLHIIEYLKNPHPANHGVLIIEEFAPVLKLAMQCVDLSALFENANISWHVGTDREKLARSLNRYFSNTRWLRYANAIEYVPLPAATAISEHFFKDVQELLPRSIGVQFNLLSSDPYDSFRGIENLVANLELLGKLPCLQSLKGLFSGRPGIVIASGPSLNTSLPFLQQAQDRAVLAACPSALPAVLAKGINPQIWLDVERNEVDADFFAGLPEKPPHVFVGTPLLHPRCFKATGGTLTYIINAVGSRWLPSGIEALPFGHSSAHAAFAILAMLGCDPIYLFGQDLAYAGSESHAGGVWDESRRVMTNIKEKQEKVFSVLGNSGQPVLLNTYWHTYLRSFTDTLIPQSRRQVLNVIPKNTGAFIAGTSQLEPEYFLASLNTLPFNALDTLSQSLSQTKPLSGLAPKKLTVHCERALTLLKTVAREARDFSLACKAFQFRHELHTKNRELLQPLYQRFVGHMQGYFSRLYIATADPVDKFHYEELLYPVLQGLFLRSFIEYFASAADLDGDTNEISRKCDILHHMTKDESFWANAVATVLEGNPTKCINPPTTFPQI